MENTNKINAVVVLKQIAHESLMLNTYMLTEENNQQLMDKSTGIRTLVVRLDKAMLTGKNDEIFNTLEVLYTG